MKRKNLSKKKRLKKLLSTSATGLVLLSTLTQPVVSLANTVEETKESEKKTVSSNEQSPIENPVNALEKTISSSSNTEATVEKADQTVETKEVNKQNEVVNAVRSLYEDEAQTIVKKTLLQTEIDSAREKVNALPDGEEKTRLVEKIDQAYNGLQEIQLKGYYDRLFSRITV
ncbi:TPA: toxin Cry1Ac domain D-VI-related protein, partial [Enterococcus hirae]